MPNITIREIDSSTSGLTDSTNNIVYVPGYANLGPVNKPTLCTSVSNFEDVFGTKPYVFRTTQTNQLTDASTKVLDATYAQNTYEKSYIYAKELLEAGLPVLFERVFTENESNWKASNEISEKVSGSATPSAKIKLTAKNPGLISKDIFYTLEKKTLQINGASKVYFKLGIGLEEDAILKTGRVEAVSTMFTFDSALSEINSMYKYYTEFLTSNIDNSGLVTIDFSGTITTTTTFDDVTTETKLKFATTPSGDETTPSGDEFNINNFYAKLAGNSSTASILKKLEDKGEYELKFITTGAYPVFGYTSSTINENSITETMLDVAGNRGDATALIDHLYYLGTHKVKDIHSAVTTFVSGNSILNTLGEDCFQYGAMYTPHFKYKSSLMNQLFYMPASFGYLKALGAMLNTTGNWEAVAGVSRGKIDGLQSLCLDLPNAVANAIQPRDAVSINPITEIKPNFGIVIWGNRTLKNNAVEQDLLASSFMNVRQYTNDVKRQVYVSSKKLTFEQNSDILWINFKSSITPLLSKITSGGGLSGYKIEKVNTNKKATLKAKIVLYSIEAVEDFDITVELSDSTAVIEG